MKIKKSMKTLLTLMIILTTIYVIVIVYARNTAANSHHDVVYAAVKYKGDTPPTEWYPPEQLGIYDVLDYEENVSSWFHIVVDRDKEPFPLQEEQPIFMYKDKYYQVSPLWVTPGLPESVKQWQIPIGGILGVGWVLTGILFFSGVRMKTQRDKSSLLKAIPILPENLS